MWHGVVKMEILCHTAGWPKRANRGACSVKWEKVMVTKEYTAVHIWCIFCGRIPLELVVKSEDI